MDARKTTMKKFTLIFIAVIIAIIGAMAIELLSLKDLSASTAFALGAMISGICVSFRCQSDEDEFDEVRPSSKTIYVGNLPYRANEHDVKILFEEHGDVFAVRLMKDKRTGKRRGFGFVVMDAADAENAIEALNECEFGDRTLKVREANDPKKSELE